MHKRGEYTLLDTIHSVLIKKAKIASCLENLLSFFCQNDSECSFFVLTFPSLFLLDTNFMKNQEIVVILGNADKRDWHFILVQLFFQLLGRRDRLFKTYFRFNKIQDNPFRIMNLMLLIFIVLWLGYINHDFLISSFSSLGIFTFFYYQNIPMKYLLKRMFLIGCGL